MAVTQTGTESKKASPISMLRSGIKEKLEEAYDDEEEMEFLEDTILESNKSLTEIQKEADEIEENDVFAKGNEYFQNNHTVEFKIKRFGKLLAHKYAPYSWKQLHKEFGEGNYKVTAYLPESNNKYLKSQTLSLDVYKDSDARKEEREYSSKAVDISMTEKERMELQEKREQRLKEEMRQERRDREELMMKMFENNKPQSSGLEAILPVLLETLKPRENSGEMLLKIQEMNQRNMEKQFETTMKLLEQQNTKMEKMFETLSDSIRTVAEPQEKGFDPMTYMKEMREAEKAGFEKYKEMMELVDIKAQEKSENEKPQSQLDQIMKTFAPLLTSIVSAQAKSPAPQAAPQRQLQAPQQAQATRQLQSSSTRVSSRPSQGLSPQASKTTNSLPSSSNRAKATNEEKKVTVDDFIFKGETDEANQEQIWGIVFPIVIESVTSGQTNKELVADSCLKALHEAKIDLRTIERDLPLKFIDDVIEQYPVAKEREGELKELHELLTRKIRSIIGQHLASQRSQTA